MNRVSALETSFVDLSAILFVVGGVSNLVMNLLTLPMISFTLPVSFSAILLIVLTISLICSLGAIHCYTLATKRMLSEAGMRGIIFGALLLIFSLGLVGNFGAATTGTWLTELSAILVLIGGIVCFILRHIVLSSSPIMRQEPIAKAA